MTTQPSNNHQPKDGKDAAPAAKAQAPAGKAIVVVPNLEGNGISLSKFLAVWASSTVINVTMLTIAFFVFMFLGKVTASESNEPEVMQETNVEDVPKDPDLTNTDLGMDDSLPLAYNVDRIEEVSVPGKVDPTAAVGIVNAPEAAPMNVPPPPGSGGGTGGTYLDPNQAGTGAIAGTVGGMGGQYNLGGFAGRSGATKIKMLSEGGGNARSEQAVAIGLQWLALHQCPDGHWSLNEFNKFARDKPLPAGKIVPDNSQPNTTQENRTAATAFGILPFLAAGITNKPPKKKPQIDYSKAVGLAIRYLINKQVKTGNDKGNYGDGMYAHGLATIAMCEAYGLTSDPMIKSSAQMGINYIVNAQDISGGGWRYAPRQPGDTSVTGWQVMALKSGQMAGLSVPRIALEKSSQFFDSCESSNKGGYSYTPGGGETPTMTAVAALCRQYMGVNPRNPSLLASIKRLKAVPPSGNNMYYEYYATQVMHHMGGDAWQFWNLGPAGTGKGGIRDTLIAKQDTGAGGRAGQKGSWDGSPHVGGRLGATSLSLLSLEVYYRHLPLYRRDMGVMKKE
jgi:hypothetical protein